MSEGVDHAGDDRFHVAVRLAVPNGFFADRAHGDRLALHFELLPRGACGRYGEPHDEVAQYEDAEQVGEEGREGAGEGQYLDEDQQQQRCEERQAHPCGVDVEVTPQPGAHPAQAGVLGVAVETARDARLLFGCVGFAFGRDVLGRSHLRDDLSQERGLHHARVLLLREDQFGDARLDVGDDFVAVGRLGVGRFETVEVAAQKGVGIGVEREGDARNTAFFDLFHGGYRLWVTDPVRFFLKPTSRQSPQ